ncbi:MAG: hypothetical protein HUN04_18345 [Desulfobacter sp.]|nr:MAG: hypothetical protein HUN04_18345 [Desulfobacter sp.]
MFSINKIIGVITCINFLLAFHFDVQAAKYNGEIEIIHSEKILKKIEQAYKNVETYYDFGTVITDIGAYTFESIYIAKGFFRIGWAGNYPYNDSLKKYAIIKHGKEIIAYSDRFKDKKIRTFNTMKDAVLKLLISSNGLLSKIPGQLFDNLGITPLTRLTGFKFIGEEIVHGEVCVVFKLHKPLKHKDANIEYRIWASKNSYFIRKIELVTAETKITYNYKKLKTNEALDVKQKDLDL